jgi:hypothetical protein
MQSNFDKLTVQWPPRLSPWQICKLGSYYNFEASLAPWVQRTTHNIPTKNKNFLRKKRGPWLDPTPTNNLTVPILRPKPETAVGCLGFPPHYQPRTLWQLTRGMWWGTCRGWPNVEANHVARSFHVMRVGQHPPVNPTRRDFVSPRSQTVPSVGFQSLVHSLIDFHALA